MRQILYAAEDVAVVERGDTVYVARVPLGPIFVLDGTGSVIWRYAQGRSLEELVDAMAELYHPPGGELPDAVSEFVAALVRRGLLDLRDSAG